MVQAQYIFEGTQQNFHDLVVQNSHRGPVMVNFWAAYAGPCLRLYPILEKLVTTYGGRFILVNVDVEKERALAQEHGITSLPHVKLFRAGRVVDTVRSYQSEGDFRRMVERHLARESDRGMLAALQTYQGGEREKALQQLAELAMADPENLRIPVTLAKLLTTEGRHAQAYDLLNALPRPAKQDPAVTLLLAHLGFLRIAAEVSDADDLAQAVIARPDDLDSRYRLAAVRLVGDRYEEALEQLMAILEQDRTFRDDAARRGLLAIFQILGETHPLTERYRRALFNALH
jgi:putative thioredoxin